MAVRAVRDFVFVALVGLLAAACSRGQAGAAGASQPASSGGGGTAATPAISGGGRAPFRASGAVVRVVNLYNGGADGPGPIDVYGDFKATGTPLITVPARNPSARGEHIRRLRCRREANRCRSTSPP